MNKYTKYIMEKGNEIKSLVKEKEENENLLKAFLEDENYKTPSAFTAKEKALEEEIKRLETLKREVEYAPKVKKFDIKWAWFLSALTTVFVIISVPDIFPIIGILFFGFLITGDTVSDIKRLTKLMKAYTPDDIIKLIENKKENLKTLKDNSVIQYQKQSEIEKHISIIDSELQHLILMISVSAFNLARLEPSLYIPTLGIKDNELDNKSIIPSLENLAETQKDSSLDDSNITPKLVSQGNKALKIRTLKYPIKRNSI